MSDRDVISISGKNITAKGSLKRGTWEIHARDAHVNGLSIPRFSINWVALNLLSGVLAQVGGLIFDALAKALGLGGRSIEELLQKQLEIIERIVVDAIKRNELRANRGRLIDVRIQMTEYLASPGSSRHKLHNADRLASQVVTDLSTFITDPSNSDVEIYGIFLCAVSLRLAVLQEIFNVQPDQKGAINVFVQWVEETLQEIKRLVIEETTPLERARRAYPKVAELAETIPFLGPYMASIQLTALSGTVIVDRRVLGFEVQDLPKLQKTDPKVREIASDYYNQWLNKNPWAASGYLTRHVKVDPKNPHFKRGVPLEFTMILQGIERILDEPQEKIISMFVDWDALRSKVEQGTTAFGESQVNGWKVAAHQLGVE